MNRSSLVAVGAVVGLVGLLGYHAASPSLPAFVVSPSPPSSASAAAAPATTMSPTTAAPPPDSTTTTAPAARSAPAAPATTTPPTTTTTRPPTTTTTRPPTTTTAPVTTTRSATGESVNYIYGVLSVEVTATGTKVSKVTIASINDGGNYRSESIDQVAIPQLEQQALVAQSANIQGVSGASYTSAGFRQSLQSALSKLGL